MEETIYIQVWTQVYAATCVRMHDSDFGEQDMEATREADAAAHRAVQSFDHAAMQAAVTAKREATDAAMKGK